MVNSQELFKTGVNETFVFCFKRCFKNYYAIILTIHHDIIHAFFKTIFKFLKRSWGGTD